MIEMEHENRFHEAGLLGVFPLLFATSRLEVALITGLVCIALALLLRFVARLVGGLDEHLRWMVLILLGSTASYLAAILLIHYHALLPAGYRMYILLTGAVPLIYAGCRAEEDAGPGGLWMRFLLLMLATGVLREVLGHGSILGYGLMPAGRVPLALLSMPSGAFIGLGTAWLALAGMERILGLDLSEHSSEGRGEAVE